MYTYMYTYMHTYMHTYMKACKHAFITKTYARMPTYTCTCMHIVPWHHGYTLRQMHMHAYIDF